MIEIISFLLKYRVWMAFGFLLVCIPCAYGIGYWDGSEAKEATIQIKTVEKIVEVQKKNVQRKKEIRKLNNDDLVRRYCHFVYDLPYDECVRTVKPVE